MTVTINGSGTIGGISVGGLNDNIITKNEMATGGAWAPAGTVLQVVQGSYSTITSSSAQTYIDTGLSASITPTSATSKILVIVSHGHNSKSNANAANSLALKLVRGSTDIQEFAVSLGYTATTISLYFAAFTSFLDSPSTTSLLTYKTQFKNGDNNGASVTVQSASMPSTITLMEIAA